MAKRGPRPKPTEVKRLRGNPGKRALNKREPTPKGHAPTIPAHLDEESKKAWRWLVKTLREMNILAVSDVAIMTLYSDVWGQYVAVRRKLAPLGEHQFIAKSTKGVFYMNPLLNVEAMLKKQLMQCLRELGLSPSARSGLSVNSDKAADPMAALLEKMNERRTQVSDN